VFSLAVLGWNVEGESSLTEGLAIDRQVSCNDRSLSKNYSHSVYWLTSHITAQEGFVYLQPEMFKLNLVEKSQKQSHTENSKE